MRVGSRSTPRDALLSRFIGQYEVLSELGSGRFGSVLLAVGEVPARGPQRPRQRVVAIKKLRADAARRLGGDALLQEFELLDQVKHRSIVRVFEYLPNEAAVVMEYVHGSSLRTVLEKLKERRVQVFTQAAVEIGCELADALYQAHTTPGDNGEPLQLVHRDLKPDNVILTPQGDVRLLDWGLARVDNADFVAEQPDRLRGTPLYMSPEQAVGHAVDHRSDLFSLGLILAELLQGTAVYAPRDDAPDPYADSLERIRTGRTQQVSSDLERMLPEVGPVLARCLSTRPGDRYPDGQALLVQLRRSLYRDRGAYLQEFAEYYFSEVEPLAPPPTLDSLGKRGRRTRMSIEERLRRSMNEPSTPAPAPRALVAPVLPVGSSEPSPSQQNSPGADMSSSSGSGSGRGGPPVPPVGGKASRSTPFSPPASGGGRRPVGQRRPDETGMLEMVPLSSDPDEAAAAADPSATAFFAIPAPKSDRGAGPAAPPPGQPAFGALPPPAAAHGAPPPPAGAFGAPPPPPAGAFSAPPPPPPGAYGAPAAPSSAAFAPSGPPPQSPPPGGAYAGGPPAGGYAPPAYGAGASATQPPVPAIQGPVASYGANTPFQVQGPPPPGASGAGKEAARTQSQRVYALVLGVLVLVFSAILVALWLRFGTQDSLDGTAGMAGSGASASGANATPPTPPERGPPAGASTATSEPVEPEPLPPRNNTRRQVTPPSPTAASRPPSTPRPSAGSLSITLQGEAGGITAVEVKCPSHRDRRSLSGNRASFSGVPNEACTLFFRGASIAKFSPVSGGQSLTCSILGTQANCR